MLYWSALLNSNISSACSSLFLSSFCNSKIFFYACLSERSFKSSGAMPGYFLVGLVKFFDSDTGSIKDSSLSMLLDSMGDIGSFVKPLRAFSFCRDLFGVVF